MIGDTYRQMGDRLDDLSGAAVEVHAVLNEWQRREQIGNEMTLGPSLQNGSHRDHIFRVLPGEFHFGTLVEYSVYHQAWRARNGRPSHMAIPAPVLSHVGEIIARHVLEGDQ